MRTFTQIICLLFSAKLYAANEIVATVNGENITLEKLEEVYKQNRFVVGPQRVTKEKVLYDLINREIGIDRAKKAGLQNDPVVKSKMEDILYHAKISKDLEPELKKIVVTDKDVETYYKENPEYRTASILLRTRANPSDEELKEALTQSIRIHAKLKEKPDLFAELANKYSQSSAAPNGGDIGFQPAVNLAPEYFTAIKGAKPGTITAPVHTQFGFHIIKVFAVKPFADINMEFYKKVVYNIKRDQILEDYFKDLRSKAKITINQGLLKNN